MNLLIKAEFFKLQRSLSYKIMMIGIVIYSLSDLYFLKITTNSTSGIETFFGSLGMWGRCFLISALFAGIFIAGDFSNRQIQKEITVGHSRAEILISKSFVYWLACLGFTIVYQVINVVGASVINGFGLNNFNEFFLYIIIIELEFLFYYSGLIMLCVLIAFIFKEIYVVSAIEIFIAIFGVQIFSSLASKIELINMIYKKTLFYFLNNIDDFVYEVKFDNEVPVLTIISPSQIASNLKIEWGNLLITIISLILIFFLSFMIFKKSDLK